MLLARASLRAMWQDRWWLSPTELLERLLRERRAYLLAVGTPRPAETWKRLRFLADQARSFEEAGGGTHLGLLVQCPSREIRDMIHGSGMEGGLQEQMDVLDALTAELR